MCQIEVYCEEQYFKNSRKKLFEYLAEKDPRLAQMVLRDILLESKPMAWSTFRVFREKIETGEVHSEKDQFQMMRLILALKLFGPECRYFEREANALWSKLPQDISIRNYYNAFLNSIASQKR